jgi:hypothetical protein
VGADLPISVPSEHAIEHDEVKVEVRVEAGSESVKEAQSPELSVAGRIRARAAQGRGHGPNEDPQHSAGDVRVALQEGTEPLRNTQDPLSHGKVRQHMIGDVGGDLGHPARVA